MRVIFYLSYLLPLCASLCGCPEDEYIEPIHYEVALPELVFVEDNQKQFAQGDTLWINIKVPQQIENYNIFQLTKTEQASLYFQFEKMENFELPFLLNFTENDIVADFGAIEVDEYNTSRLVAHLQRDGELYRSRVGIVLRSEGNFLLSEINVAYNEPPNQFSIWFSDEEYHEEPVENVIILTTIRESNEEGKYEFKVGD